MVSGCLNTPSLLHKCFEGNSCIDILPVDYLPSPKNFGMYILLRIICTCVGIVATGDIQGNTPVTLMLGRILKLHPQALNDFPLEIQVDGVVFICIYIEHQCIVEAV